MVFRMSRKMNHACRMLVGVIAITFLSASPQVLGLQLCDELLTRAERVLNPGRVLDLGAGSAQFAKRIRDKPDEFDRKLLNVVGRRDVVESIDLEPREGLDHVGDFQAFSDQNVLGRYDTISLFNPYGIDVADTSQLKRIRKHLLPGGQIVVVGAPANRFMPLKINGTRVKIKESFRQTANEAGFEVSLTVLDSGLVGEARTHATMARFMITLTVKDRELSPHSFVSDAPLSLESVP
jgi:hypothetical protein